MDDEFPLEFEALDTFVDQQPPEVQEAFHFYLAVAMEEKGKSVLVNTAQVDGRTYYSYRTVAGDVFSMPRSEIAVETKRVLRQELMKILEEGS